MSSNVWTFSYMSSDVHLWVFIKGTYWKSITDSWKNQDGGVGRLGTHLPQWTHQKFIHTWNNYHWKLTRHWQKDSCTTKAIIKIHMKSGRKSNEQVRLWVSEKELRLKGRSWAESLPEDWAVRDTYSIPQSHIMTQGRQAPWLVGGSVGITGECGKPKF